MKEGLVYQVKGWNEFFENNKSRQFKFKSQASMPGKFGLGYAEIMSLSSDNKYRGPAIYGAWCALIILLSKHHTRQGWLTISGDKNDRPYTTKNLSTMLRMDESIVFDMIDVCSSENVGWLLFYPQIKIISKDKSASLHHEDITRTPCGHNADTEETPRGGIVDVNVDVEVNRRFCPAGGAASSDLFKKIFDLAKTLEGVREDFNVYAFIKQNSRFHPQAMIDCLTYFGTALKEKNNGSGYEIDNPHAYGRSILQQKSPNYFEQEHTTKSKEASKDLKSLIESLAQK